MAKNIKNDINKRKRRLNFLYLKFHKKMILEILEEKVPIRKGRSNPMEVKRKGSSYNVVRTLGKTKIDEYIYTVKFVK